MTPPNYRMKSEGIWAEQFFIERKPWPRGVKEIIRVTSDGDHTAYIVMTPEGPSSLRNGDWVITNKEGISLTYNKDAFEKDYEPI